MLAVARNRGLTQAAAQFRGLRDVREEIDRLLAVRRSLVVETVLGNEAYVRLARHAKTLGYGVRLLFIGVKTVEEAIARVAAHVAKGGHDVGEADIRRRWPKAHGNLARLATIVDEVNGRVTHLDPAALPALTAALMPLLR